MKKVIFKLVFRYFHFRLHFLGNFVEILDNHKTMMISEEEYKSKQIESTQLKYALKMHQKSANWALNMMFFYALITKYHH